MLDINNMDILENNQIKEFNTFLQKHIVRGEKGEKVEYTHTRFAPPFGKYNIPDNEYDKFINLYKKVVGKIDLHLTEKQKDVGPFLIDIDYRQDIKYKTRQYTTDHIERLVEISSGVIRKYLKVTKSDLEAFVWEKEKPSFDTKANNYKDGIHIIYPIPVDVKTRYFLREKIKEISIESELFGNINYVEETSYDDIFDVAVVKRNGWLMYGSKKPEGQIYELTNIYNSDIKKEKKDKYSDDELVILMAIRKFMDDDVLKIRDENTMLEIEEVYDKYCGPKKKKEQPKKNNKVDNKDERYELQKSRFAERLANNDASVGSKEQEIALAKKLTKILSDKRAVGYQDWIHVGWALHNIDDSLLEDFINFSKKSAAKYQEGCCEKVWDQARNEGLSISSLHWWAQKDNPKEYVKILRSNMNELMKKSETGSHNDIALIVYEMYKHSYKCVSIKKGIWLEFQGHKWVRIDSAYTLANKISDELSKEFSNIASLYFREVSAEGGIEKDGALEKAKKAAKNIEKVKNEGFINSVMNACARRFYDGTFEKKLDSNNDLLGFNNGVYDLKMGCFRDGLPDDYITMSVGYDYKDFTNIVKTDPSIIGVKEYFSKVMIDPEMRKYVLTLIASYLDGHARHQKFILWTGGGGNGKSATVNMVQYMLGDYFGVLPTTILTRKEGGSSNATPELADKHGKRVLVIQEPEHNDVVYVGRMKNFTGGDWIQARALYGDPFTYKPQFKLMLTCNKLPNIPATDGGTWRRLRVTPWESTFVDGVPKKKNEFPKDPELDDKMKEWKQALVWWLLKDYYQEYRKNGIYEPPKVTSMTDQYKKKSDIYYEFLSEQYIITGNNRDKSSIQSAYDSFKTWFRNGNTGSPPNRNEFIEYMNTVDKLKVINGNVFGLIMKSDREDEDNNDKEDGSKISNNSV